jgi:triphosphoribosyl-dephospho-CoA synthase CitG
MEKSMRIEYCHDMLKKIEGGFTIFPEAFKIGEAAILGMLYEVSASPSPGLVSPYSSGSHSDMDFFTFLNSTASIAHSMYMCAQIGIDYDNDILKRLRSVGIYAEKNMLKATEGVNTQRGLLFLAGVVCAAAGRSLKNRKFINRYTISEECAFICKGIVERELKAIKNEDELSNGELLYLKYGVTGIRGEVENGLPSVLNVGLPLYEEALSFGLKQNEALSHSLIGLMTCVEDTTVINRCGIEGLDLMRKLAKMDLELGGMKTSEGRSFIREMEVIFEENKISPGGAADLLAVTAMIYKLEKDFRAEVER